MPRSKQPSFTVTGHFEGDDNASPTTQSDTPGVDVRSTPRGNLVGRANLQDIKLISLEYGITPQSADMDLKRRFNGKVVGVDFNPELGSAFVFTSWTLEGVHDEGEERAKKPIILDAMFLAVYVNMKGIGASEVERFMKQLVPFAVYPYFRGLVSQLAWMGGVPLPPMPVLRSPPPSAASPTKTPPKPRKRRSPPPQH